MAKKDLNKPRGRDVAYTVYIVIMALAGCGLAALIWRYVREYLR